LIFFENTALFTSFFFFWNAGISCLGQNKKIKKLIIWNEFILVKIMCNIKFQGQRPEASEPPICAVYDLGSACRTDRLVVRIPPLHILRLLLRGCWWRCHPQNPSYSASGFSLRFVLPFGPRLLPCCHDYACWLTDPLFDMILRLKTFYHVLKFLGHAL
jgi:hypothetical protein